MRERTMTSSGHGFLENIAKDAREAKKKGTKYPGYVITPRGLLREFNAQRRGRYVVAGIRNALEQSGLHTVPDFDRVWIDSPIIIELRDKTTANDPTIRVDALPAAHQEPTVVHPDWPVRCAKTLMSINDFSQLPVTDEKRRKIRGVISWQSIGDRPALGRHIQGTTLVRHLMDTDVSEVSYDAPLLDAVAVISRHGYTLVRGKENSITGIVTATDVVQMFVDLAEPFLLLGEIEGYLRTVASGKFTPEQLAEACRRTEPDATAGLDDLDLGGYCQLFGKEEHWRKTFGSELCRRIFIKRLHEVRQVRNDVMHFSPDDPSHEELQMLRRLTRFFRNHSP
ncbi:MAG: CBS domain-containing protein [Acidobacteria bacterium]|nr:CBS domain-containing protein [Acidobacteriota bacterium]